MQLYTEGKFHSRVLVRLVVVLLFTCLQIMDLMGVDAIFRVGEGVVPIQFEHYHKKENQEIMTSDGDRREVEEAGDNDK